MTSAPGEPRALPVADFAPRSPRRTGARRRWGFPALWAAAALAVASTPVLAQDPPPPPPTVGQVADSLVQLSDSALQAAQDTLPADTIFYNFPRLERRNAEGFRTGVWSWDRDAIMASGANTLAELFAEVPGMVPLWGGDYGTPVALSAFALGGGGVRVFRDGFEVYPVEGGVADLQHVGLVGIARVRLDRSMGGMRVELHSHEFDDGRPFSVVEAGTGDLDTNIFRGTFAEPTALGGSLGLGMERVDTRGRGPDEGGNRTGTWVRYQLHREERGGIALEFRGMSSQTKVTDYAQDHGRSDLTLRARYRVAEGVVAEGYTGRSSLNAADAGTAYETWGGRRSQHGVRLGVELGSAWAVGEARFFGSDELPARIVDAAGGWRGERLGLAGSATLGSWAGATETLVGARAWAGPFGPFSVFGAFESGSHGARDGPLLDQTGFVGAPLPLQPTATVPMALSSERTTSRIGGSLELAGITLSGAALTLEVDPFLPLGLELDHLSPTEPGGSRTGFEGFASLPMPMEGLRLQGSYQRWDADAPFLPEQIYQASFEFHRVYLETGNFEWWWSAGVRGHDPMSVFVPGDGMTVPGGLQGVRFYQNWYARTQIRIVTVRLFLGWENISIRRGLESFPGRPLPVIRSFFGLRWDMWS